MAHAKRETSIQLWQVCNGRERGRKPNTRCLYSYNVEGKSPTSPNHAMRSAHVYEVRPRKDKRGVDHLIIKIVYAII
jgi:hypothetical protein